MYAEHEWIWNGYVLISGGDLYEGHGYVPNEFHHSIVGHWIGLILALCSTRYGYAIGL